MAAYSTKQRIFIIEEYNPHLKAQKIIPGKRLELRLNQRGTQFQTS